ncbi:MAG: 4-(cytidine 5'-diphospho)-2-C-methyl-D-erythritol kinase [Rhizobiaceae bacterium]
MIVGCQAPAKVNLALHVTGRREDGYHTLDTLAGFFLPGDHLSAKLLPDDDDRLSIIGPFAANLPVDGDNLVLKAARALREAARASGYAAGGVSFELVKNLPVASGIGGGSADAAAALLALRHLWQLPDGFDLSAVALTLGADVPMCLLSAPVRARGIGERLENLAWQREQDMVLVNPGVSVSTPQVFQALRGQFSPGLGEIGADPFSAEHLSGLGNDLEKAAMQIAPEIGLVLEMLQQQEGVSLCGMSGSGATCYALFDNGGRAEAARLRLIDKYPGWWCVRGTLLGKASPERVTINMDATD